MITFVILGARYRKVRQLFHLLYILSYLNFLFPALASPHKEDAVHPDPILLYNVEHFENFAHQFIPLNRRHHKVGIVDNFIIGNIICGYLLPLVAPRADLSYELGRVKVQIHGNIANITEPLLTGDPINNNFFHKFEEHNIRDAELVE